MEAYHRHVPRFIAHREKTKEVTLSALVQDAIPRGQVVLVANTLTAQKTAIAREVIEGTIAAVRETSTA